MTSPLLWTLVLLQIVMGAFDTLYHYEMTERLAWRPSQRHELTLHAIRNLLYAALFLTLGWLEVHGIWALLVMVVLAAEVIITLMDFVEEDMSRKLPASERVNHTLLALNYGAILVLVVPVLAQWSKAQTGIATSYQGAGSVIATIAALGIIIFGCRDLLASRRVDALRRTLANARDLVASLGTRRTVLVTGASGF